MAIFRLHRKQWEKGYAVVPIRAREKSKAKEEPNGPRQRKSIGTEGGAKRPTKASLSSETKRKSVSSGLSTVVRRRTKVKGEVGRTKVKWWSQLGPTRGSSKGHITVIT